MGFAYFLEVIRKRWWLVATSVLLCTGSAYLLLSRTPTWYQATTTVRNPYIYPQQATRLYKNLIREPAILVGAAQTVGLPYVPSPDKVSARLVPDSLLIEITVRDTDPEHARALADAIGQQLLLREEESFRARGQDMLQRWEESIRQTKEKIQEEAVRLDAADSAVAIQQHKGNIADLQEVLASMATDASELQAWVNEPPTVIIEQLATTPTRPIRSPPVPQTLLLAAVLGLILGLVGAFFMESRAGGRAKERKSTAAGGGD